MRWKSILSLIIILGLVGVTLNTQSGQKYMDWLKEKFGGILSFLEMVPSIGRGEPFTVVLTVNVAEKNPFLGTTWKASDSGLEIVGLCESIKPSEAVHIKVENGTGRFDIDAGGNVIISLESINIKIDNITWPMSTIEKNITVFNDDFSFKISGLSKDSIIFSSITGDVKKFTGDGKEEMMVNMKDRSLEIRDFDGTLQFEGSTQLLTLEGKTSGVTGEEFNWVKAGK